MLSNKLKINLADLDVAVDVLGPGKRVIIWVQGCPHRCYNCITPAMQPFEDREWIEAEELASRVLSFGQFEGITLLGGEPFCQAKGLCHLIDLLKEKIDLTVFSFSGYTLEELKESSDVWITKLLCHTDILVDGEYREELACDLLWRGSSNQKMYFLSDRYGAFEHIWQTQKERRLNFSINQEGYIRILGIPSPDFLKNFSAKLEERGFYTNWK